MKRQIERIIAAGGAVALAAVLAGCSGGSNPSTDQNTVLAQGGPPVTPGPGGAPGPGVPGAGAVPGAQPGPAGQAKTATVVPPPHNADPFKPWWSTIPPPPPVLSMVTPVRIAMAGSAEPVNQPGITVKEVPTMRVAGILTGRGVYALLDGPTAQGQVVRPGDQVGDYKVESINSDSVTLKRTEKIGNATQTFVQVIPLSDTPFSGGTGMGGPAVGGSGIGGPPGPGGRRGGGPVGGPAGLGTGAGPGT